MESSSSSLQKINNNDSNAKAPRLRLTMNAGDGAHINPRHSRPPRRTRGSKINRAPPPKKSTGGGGQTN
ncbi:hypothetical protein E5676_scaffold600G001020 [Cucumis melo var. makuwa]|uniref:Uncharacterized protein n=1 Tax=Cucumis melo var. makuwa TaxID=1194695 RepID=A0A5D3DY74_CUCMM|nr:hypothetical protein E6C27_scaffold61G001060 [Cucumis melo var. makuwa]TYK28285.1 hypothetical protein E5676_scaffold600G001020 [Cucumis melo var. makuwa]